MKRTFFTLVILFLITGSFKGFSQGNANFHLGVALPMGDFGDEDVSGAGIGVNAGYRYNYKITEFGLGIFAGVDFFFNPLKKEIKEDIEEAYGDAADIIYSKYFNVPISAGLSYQLEVNKEFSLICNVGGTCNFLKISDYTVDIVGKSAYESKYDWTNAFGFKVGGGFLIKEKTSIEVNYFALGEHEITANNNLAGIESEGTSKMEVGILTVTLATRF